eukprot:489849_1
MNSNTYKMKQNINSTIEIIRPKFKTLLKFFQVAPPTRMRTFTWPHSPTIDNYNEWYILSKSKKKLVIFNQSKSVTSFQCEWFNEYKSKLQFDKNLAVFAKANEKDEILDKYEDIPFAKLTYPKKWKFGSK